MLHTDHGEVAAVDGEVEAINGEALCPYGALNGGVFVFATGLVAASASNNAVSA